MGRIDGGKMCSKTDQALPTPTSLTLTGLPRRQFWPTKCCSPSWGDQYGKVLEHGDIQLLCDNVAARVDAPGRCTPAGTGALAGADLAACAGRVADQLSSPGHRRRVTLQP